MTRHDTKAGIASEAGAQLAYILSALGMADDWDVHFALCAAVEAGTKADARTLAEALRRIKTAVRELAPRRGSA